MEWAVEAFRVYSVHVLYPVVFCFQEVVFCGGFEDSNSCIPLEVVICFL